MRGSDALCGVVGRSRYQLILSFLPIVCAITGNAALQSREVTMRAIASNPMSVRHDWFIKEIVTSVFHGIVMGIALGLLAYFVSGLDMTFGFTILVVQLSSIIVAGLTGTMLPLLCRSTLQQETGQWSLLLLTACQDIIGSFASIVLSYYVIVQLSAKAVTLDDACIVHANP
jgi:Mg/Co/Ni transporter MgtE